MSVSKCTYVRKKSECYSLKLPSSLFFLMSTVATNNDDKNNDDGDVAVAAAKGKNCFLENIELSESVECLCRALPVLRKGKCIVESEYRLTLLDIVELIIALLKKETSIVKQKRKMQEESHEKLKVNEGGKRNSKKIPKNNRRKAT